MNTLTTRKITPADVLAERAIRAKVLYSPCAEQDIKWRWCDCYVCRSVWDPTGEQDAERANAAATERSTAPEAEELKEDPVAVIPTCLPPPAGSNETVILTGTEVNNTIRFLEAYKEQISKTISKIIDHMESKITEDYYPIGPPELDNLYSTKSSVMNLIDDLKKKPRTVL